MLYIIKATAQKIRTVSYAAIGCIDATELFPHILRVSAKSCYAFRRRFHQTSWWRPPYRFSKPTETKTRNVSLVAATVSFWTHHLGLLLYTSTAIARRRFEDECSHCITFSEPRYWVFSPFLITKTCGAIFNDAFWSRKRKQNVIFVEESSGPLWNIEDHLCTVRNSFSRTLYCTLHTFAFL